MQAKCDKPLKVSSFTVYQRTSKERSGKRPQERSSSSTQAPAESRYPGNRTCGNEPPIKIIRWIVEDTEARSEFKPHTGSNLKTTPSTSRREVPVGGGIKKYKFVLAPINAAPVVESMTKAESETVASQQSNVPAPTAVEPIAEPNIRNGRVSPGEIMAEQPPPQDDPPKPEFKVEPCTCVMCDLTPVQQWTAKENPIDVQQRDNSEISVADDDDDDDDASNVTIPVSYTEADAEPISDLWETLMSLIRTTGYLDLSINERYKLIRMSQLIQEKDKLEQDLIQAKAVIEQKILIQAQEFIKAMNQSSSSKPNNNTVQRRG